ncbi:MAG: right-handed parallel beta-helix repeat-containing protein [Lewinellaceae bacterium]|nr:right-handed parallel beta-helix repeat-containing protein [Lewinellaceae bacterium]
MLLLLCSHLTATTYYVDAQNGSDNYNGTAPTHQSDKEGPWKSLSKVNATRFSPGDRILFKRGSTWTDGPLEPRNGGTPGGTVTIHDSVIGKPFSFDLVDPDNNNCIYFGAYGEGPKPKIDCQGKRGIIIRHNYIIVENLHFDNGDNNVVWLAAEDGNFWVNIFHVDVTNTRANAVRSSYGGGHLWLKGLYVYNYGVNGILLNGSKNNKLKGVLVEDCRVEDPETVEKEDAITCHRDKEGNDMEGDVIIRNNTIRNSGEDGIDITTGHNILLEGNDIRHSYSGGIYIVKDWVSTVEARGNFLFSNSISKGVGDLTIEVPDVWVYNNVIAGSGHHCLLIGSTDNVKIWNNVIAPKNRTGNFIWFREDIGKVEFKNNIFDFSQTDQDISGDIVPGISFDYNCYYGTSESQRIYGKKDFREMRAAHPGFEPHGVWADPQFAGPQRNAPEHFMPASGSPCIDKGAEVPIKVDIRGAARPQGAGADLGIYELGAADCNPDPNITSFPGSPCDDGDPNTANDIYQDDCRCAGTPGGPCAGIGDADSDGICADADCDDNDAGIAYRRGDACDDGDPNTVGETIQDNCRCGGGTIAPLRACARISNSRDDAEEWASGKVDLASSDLELTEDPRKGPQYVGLRFNTLSLPKGATVTRAYLQFTVDETRNVEPCELVIHGLASDNTPPFSNAGADISSRTRTRASVAWRPEKWLNDGDAQAAQQTPDLAAIIREIVERPGYSPNSAIGLLIEGTGARTADSYDGRAGKAPELCVEYTLGPATSPGYDCPALQANVGDACDDGDNTTVNDAIDGACRCAGIPTPCTGIGDADGDGICTGTDCDDRNAAITTKPGDACDDGNPNTSGEVIQADCSCGGGTIKAPPVRACARISDNKDDAEEDGDGNVSLSSTDLELANDPKDGDQAIGLRFAGLGIPPGAAITGAYLQFTVDENKDLDPCQLVLYGQASDEAPPFSKEENDLTRRPRTTAQVSWAPPAWRASGDANAAQRTPDLSPILQEIVNRPGYTAGSSIVLLIEGKGRRTAVSRNGSAEKAPELCVEYVAGGSD